MKYTIGTFEFSSKSEAQKKVSKMLKGYTWGTRVSDADAELLLEIARNHPWKSLIAKPISHFMVTRDPNYKSKRFSIIRQDGSQVEMALTRFWETKNRSKRDVFRKKCREAVGSQIVEFKRQEYGYDDTVRCAITDEQVYKDECHVDHVYPFEDMIIDWENKTNKDYSQKSIEGFSEYHRLNAKLRCVSKHANMSRGRARNE